MKLIILLLFSIGSFAVFAKKRINYKRIYREKGFTDRKVIDKDHYCFYFHCPRDDHKDDRKDDRDDDYHGSYSPIYKNQEMIYDFERGIIKEIDSREETRSAEAKKVKSVST